MASVARTVMSSVVFIDIVEYSKNTTAKQLAQKGWLNELLADALKGGLPSDRIVLDTGDGAAICFLGDPEEALFVTSCIRVAMARSEFPGFALRIGINLGPVKAVKDLNGQPNIVGDGINVAQRVMSFAQPGQILVSRSFHEVVSRLSEDHAGVFRAFGEHLDKHGRSHELYEICAPREAPEGEDREPEGAATPASAPREAPDEAMAFDPADLDRLEKLLVVHVGPMAGVLVRRAAQRAGSHHELVAELAEAIDSRAERVRFEAAAGRP